jgi:hypothetical protein
MSMGIMGPHGSMELVAASKKVVPGWLGNIGQGWLGNIRQGHVVWWILFTTRHRDH